MDKPTSGELHDSQKTGLILGLVLFCTAHVINCGYACSHVNPPLVVLSPRCKLWSLSGVCGRKERRKEKFTLFSDITGAS